MYKKIIASVATSSGIHFHRLVNPLAYLPISDDIQIYIVHIGQEKQLSCDILMYNKWLGIMPDEVKVLQSAGMKVIVDVDDYWEIPPHHPNYKYFQQAGTPQITIEHIKLANVVTCTTERLRDQILQYNKNVVIVPNALPFDRDQYQPAGRDRAREMSSNDKMRFMYLGGITHKEDIRLLEGKFQRIGGDDYIRNKAEFILCGYTPQYHDVAVYSNPEDYKVKNENFRKESKQVKHDGDYMTQVFSSTNSFRIYPSVDTDTYLNYYDSADIALAPLQNTFWNSMKSELKVIEAAAKHIPVMCSRVKPYSDMCEFSNNCGILWVENQSDWIELIRYCIKNPEYVKEQGERLYEWISKEYDLIEINKLRMQIFNSL